MASQLELSARAALCKQLAELEPTNRVLWMAEAENWSRLSNEKLRGAKLSKRDRSVFHTAMGRAQMRRPGRLPHLALCIRRFVRRTPERQAL
jgi:hypothetical protein